MAWVLDSLALLAVLQGEVGGSRVKELIDAADSRAPDLNLTVINLGEVIYNVERRRSRVDAVEAQGLILSWPINILDVDSRLALEAARLKVVRRMGYLDCFVLALALQLDATVVTGDPDFHRVEDLLQVEWLPSA